ncbi:MULTISPECIES: hypothetical protein [unclassified Erwinia]|uniref:hypothetical protein n=1 Tax=unclassified Erwinia TaxID=2622719 RepID=UPI00117873B6|nr:MULTISPECIES: hypothetical protein [unclassified Erwinia]
MNTPDATERRGDISAGGLITGSERDSRQAGSRVCVRMDARQGGDSLLAPFTTAVSRQGTTPGHKSYPPAPRSATGNGRQ